MSTPSPIRLYLWPQRVLYLGPSPDNERHRHHAAQICVSLEGTLRIESDGVTVEASAVAVAPDYPHRIDAGDARILAIYLEPESDEYASLVPSFFSGDSTEQLRAFEPAPDNLKSLQGLCLVNNDPQLAWTICASALGLGSCSTQRRSRDARVEKVITLIQVEPNDTHSVDRLANAVHISPSRLSHLFRDNVGVPIRRYIVWSRIRQVVQLAINGATLTEAAHSAGFADAAHMSNSFRQMFGFAPSALFATQVSKDVQLLE